MRLLSNVIELNYGLPNGHDLKLTVSSEEYFGTKMRKHARRLLSCYEQDMLFIDKKADRNIQKYLDIRYNRDNSKRALDEIRTLEAIVFAPISSQLDHVDFTITAESLKKYFESELQAEFVRLKSSENDTTLEFIRSSGHAEALLRCLLTQFALEFLIEGAPMGMYATGAFGILQSHLIRIFQDEMGNGVPEDKHSHLYEKTMTDLGLSNVPNEYADYYLTSNMLVSAYTYRICHDKSKFLRYLGAFFRNEACFITWQKQLGESVRAVFRGKVDCRYFDVHTDVDQSHGRWVLGNLLGSAFDQFGDAAAPHILRGFVELMIYQDLFNLELNHQLLVLSEMNGQNNNLKIDHAIKISDLDSEHIFSGNDLLIDAGPDGRLFLSDPLSGFHCEPGSRIRLPANTSALVRAGTTDVSIVSLN